MPLHRNAFRTAQTRCVFIVEGDEVVRSALNFMLSDTHATHAVPTLAEAYARAQEREPDILLLGIGIVRAHGTAVIEDIGIRWPHTRVLLVADSSADALGRACVAAGAAGIIAKPIAYEAVHGKLNALPPGPPAVLARAYDAAAARAGWAS